MTVGYMVSAYPARSHTFIRREIEELEKRQLRVMRYSQRKYDRSEILNDAEEQEYNNTWSIFPLSFIDILRVQIDALLHYGFHYLTSLIWAIKMRPPGVVGVLYAVWYFFQAATLAKKMREDGVTCLHIHFVNSGGYIGAIAAKLNKIPWGVSVHGRSDFDFPGVHALRWVVKEAGFLRCVSYFGASQAMRQCESKYWEKIFVCYCGLPDQLINGIKKSNEENISPVLLSVGRLSAEKGQFLLLKVAAELKVRGYDFNLKIIGDGPDRVTLKSAARRLKVDSVCEFPGAVDEAGVMKEMASADIFLCPSLMEGLPQVLMEAMAVKLPVVSPWLSGIPELIEHRESGMLYATGDWKGMVDAIEQLLKDPGLAVHCAASGYKRLIDQFVLSGTIEPLAQRIKKINSVEVE